MLTIIGLVVVLIFVLLLLLAVRS
uniref:Uncharacterized protein n=1 Tax=Caenorhabditis japonica TaxID=281687 RepID=A0A8R1IKA7_CAEJA